jgi:hypothetical protein
MNRQETLARRPAFKLDRAALGAYWRTLVGWGAIVLGAVVMLIGWLGVSGETEVAKQLPYLISGGVGGLALVGGGVGFLVSEDLRSERNRIGRLESEVLEIRDLVRSLAEAPPPSKRSRTR